MRAGLSVVVDGATETCHYDDVISGRRWDCYRNAVDGAKRHLCTSVYEDRCPCGIAKDIASKEAN